MVRYRLWTVLVLIAAAERWCPAAPGDLILSVGDPSPQSWALFGENSAAFMQGNLLVGARGQMFAGLYQGAAYLLNGQTGAVLTTFHRPVNQDYDMFGWSVASLGDQVAVGDPRLYVGGEYVGAVHLFDPSTGALVRTLANPNPQRHDYFGWRLATMGQNLLISAEQEGGRNGTVYLMDPASGAVLREFQSPDPNLAWHFGHALASAGRYVLVGCPDYDIGGLTNSGAVFLYDGMTGQLLRTFQSPTPQAYGNFGKAIAISGERVLIGDASADKAYLYDASAGTLKRTFADQWGDRGAFGSVLAFAGDKPLISTQYGPVRMFAGDTGALLATMNVPNAGLLPSGYYASEISLSANDERIVAGNPGVIYYFPGGRFARDSGAIYVFDVPEPATLSLLALGGLALMRRRRK